MKNGLMETLDEISKDDYYSEMFADECELFGAIGMDPSEAVKCRDNKWRSFREIQANDLSSSGRGMSGYDDPSGGEGYLE